MHSLAINSTVFLVTFRALRAELIMGAAASAMVPDSSISLDKAKELAGHLWSAELEAKFNTSWEEKEKLTLRDLQRIVPLLFIDPEQLQVLSTIQDITMGAGEDWNETFQGLFDANKGPVLSPTPPGADEGAEGAAETPTEASNDAPAEAPVEAPVEAVTEGPQEGVAFAVWKTLLPQLFETAEERAVRQAIEFKAMLERRAEGEIVVNYQMYNELFPVSKNSITAARIDEDYGLTDVMPGCRIRLSTLDSARRTLYENENGGCPAPWAKEEPEGTFQELLAGETYYCIVIEDPAQYKKDMDILAGKMALLDKDTEAKPRQEGCSCLYGNPCQDQYVCLDWDNRWKVSLANGMTKEEVKRAGIIPGNG